MKNISINDTQRFSFIRARIAKTQEKRQKLVGVRQQLLCNPFFECELTLAEIEEYITLCEVTVFEAQKETRQLLVKSVVGDFVRRN